MTEELVQEIHGRVEWIAEREIQPKAAKDFS
jgi:hypothetical protein